MKANKTTLLMIALLIGLITRNGIVSAQTIQYRMPGETSLHEGTWLQWPHQYSYGTAYRNSLDATWVAMTAALVNSEKVHIIAYNTTEKTRIVGLLTTAGISQANIDFRIHQTDDVWARDNAGIFVFDNSNILHIADLGFNGWGKPQIGSTSTPTTFPYTKDNLIPIAIGGDVSVPVVNLNTMTLEGGAFENDDNGTFLATKSAILNSNRNPGVTQTQFETFATTNFGFTKFIWLDGVAGLEITDMHIDGFVHFANDSTIVTMNNADLIYWQVPQADINTLYAAKNKYNKPYHFVYVPLSANNVSTTAGKNLGYKGSYVNYYICNNVVLVPNYNDSNDAIANAIIQGIHPGKTVIGIDVRNLYENGGMVHCVTQQQPAVLVTGMIENKSTEITLTQNFPNPCKDVSTIEFELQRSGHVTLEIYNSLGELVSSVVNSTLSNGAHSYQVNTSQFKNGIYTYILRLDNSSAVYKKMTVLK